MQTLLLATLAFTSMQVPLKVPDGWESSKTDDALTMSPKGLAAGKLYTVLVPTLTRKIGTLKGLVAAGRETLGEIGTYKPSKEPVRAKNDAGWEYDSVIGTIEKDGGAVLGQIVALQKGKDEGLVLLVSDSIETMEKYSDAFVKMIRTLGEAPAAGRAAKVDLKFTLPEGWTKKEDATSTLLEGIEEQNNITNVFRILILPSEPMTGSLRKTYLALWEAQLKPALETTIAPLPFIQRLKSGAVCAWDIDSNAKNQKGDKLCGGLYVLARGKRVVPLLVFQFNYVGGIKGLEKAFTALLESAEVPDAGSDTIELFAAEDLVGEWGESSSSFANYVDRSGGYAGDATVTTASYVTLTKEGTYKSSFIALSGTSKLKEKDEGTWKLEDNTLVLTGKEKPQKYTLFGVGADPKAGAFLVRSTYPNSDEQPDLCRPRRSFSGQWYKRK